MLLSDDIIFITYNAKYLAYNYVINKAIFLSKETYDFIEKIKKSEVEFEEFIKFLSKDEYDALVRNGVIIEDLSEYKKMSYSLKLRNRMPKVQISTVYFHVTQRCNLKCSYCYNKNNLNKPDQLNTQQIKDVIYKLYEKGVKHIIFTGGEATLRSDLLEIVKYSKSLKIGNTLLTNGTNLLNKIELLEYIDYMIISLDTLNTNNNQRFGLNIEKLVTELKEVSKKYRNKIAVRSVVSKYNLSDIEEMKKVVEEEIGVKFISALFIPNNLSEVKYMVDRIDVKPDCESQNFSGNICGASYKILAIDSNGDLYPCQCLVKAKYNIGNILEENWFDSLEKHVITRDFMRRTVLDIKQCQNCEFKYLCGGGCRAIADNLYNDLNAFIECLCPFQKDIAKNKLMSLIEKYG